MTLGSGQRLHRTTVAAGALAVLLATVGLAVAQAPGPPSTPAPDAPSPIPLVEIATRADEVTAFLAQVDEAAVSADEIRAIESNLAERAARLKASREDTLQRLNANPPLPVVERLAASWQATCATDVRASADAVTGRAARLEQDVDRLAELREAWTQTRSDAVGANAPAVVLGRIDEIRTAISSTKARLEARLAAILVVQHRLRQEVARCDQIVARIAQARRELFEGLGTRTGLPVWSGDLWAGAAAQLPEAGRVGAETFDAIARRVVRGPAGRLPLSIACFLVLLVLLYRVRGLVRRRGGSAEVATLGAVFERPISAAIVLAWLSGIVIFHQELWPFLYLAGLIGVVPVLRLMRPLVDRGAAGLYAFGALFVFDQLRFLITAAPLLEHVAFLIEMLVATGLVAWLRATGRLPTLAGREAPPRRAVATVLLVAFATAFVTGALGYTHLARLVGLGALGSSYLGLVIAVIVRALRDLMAYALRARPLRHLRVVQRHREVIEGRALALLRWLGSIAWVIGSLSAFTILDKVTDLVGRGLALPLGWGAAKASVGDLLAFGVAVWAAVVIGRLTRFVLQEDVFPRVRMARGLPAALSGAAQYVIVTLGLFLALVALGVDFTRLTIILGALGVGVGFGLQNAVSNVVAGLILFFERSIRVGDVVRIGDIEGEVQAMRMRASTIRTWGGAEVIVPNADLIAEKVTNLTLSDRRIRVEIPIGVPHGTPPDQVSRLLVDVARAHPNVLAAPPPTVLFQSLGDSALQLELRCWADDLNAFLAVRSEVTAAAYAALAGAGIPIAAPRRTVRVTMEAPPPPATGA
jgi:small-conductance mechanosensitive channel